jgi:type 1 fimbriae regulatory protein FimB/type 1 fimbriae regulatory protein FimE
MSNVSYLPTRLKGSPTVENGKVTPPRRKKYAEVRSREYLTADEIEKLLAAARATGRYSQRDATLVMVMYRHGLRVSEACSLRWDAVDFKAGNIAVNRLKGGIPSTHPLRGPELRALRQLRKDWPDSSYLFVSERAGPMTSSNVRKLLTRLGQHAKLPFPVHPHMLRHATGFKLANDGADTRAIQGYLGHANIRHTTRYTELSPNRFKAFFRD